jgi:hypothetical protein
MTLAKYHVYFFAFLILAVSCQEATKIESTKSESTKSVTNISESIRITQLTSAILSKANSTQPVVATQSTNITWNNSVFSAAPELLITMKSRLIDYTTGLVVNFCPGPINQTNVLLIAAGYNQDDQDVEYHILNSTDLYDELEYLNQNTRRSLQSLRAASTINELVVTVYEEADVQNVSQIFYTVTSGDDLVPKAYLITNNTDKYSAYTIEELLVNGTSPVLIFSKSVNNTNVTLYAVTLVVEEEQTSNLVTLYNSSYSNVTCDVNMTTLLCVFASNNTLYRALISSNSELSIGALFQGDLNGKFVFEDVQNCEDYFIIVLSNSSATETDLSVIIVNQTVIRSDFALKENSLKFLRKLRDSNATASPFVDSASYYDGFAILYSSVEDGVRGWYYDLFNKDASVNQSKVQIATVPADPVISKLYVTKEFGTGALNVLGYSISPFNQTSTVPIYYGQLFNETIARTKTTIRAGH